MNIFGLSAFPAKFVVSNMHFLDFKSYAEKKKLNTKNVFNYSNNKRRKLTGSLGFSGIMARESIRGVELLIGVVAACGVVGCPTQSPRH
jgi:hypothetical protein